MIALALELATRGEQARYQILGIVVFLSGIAFVCVGIMHPVAADRSLKAVVVGVALAVIGWLLATH